MTATAALHFNTNADRIPQAGAGKPGAEAQGATEGGQDSFATVLAGTAQAPEPSQVSAAPAAASATTQLSKLVAAATGDAETIPVEPNTEGVAADASLVVPVVGAQPMAVTAATLTAPNLVGTAIVADAEAGNAATPTGEGAESAELAPGATPTGVVAASAMASVPAAAANTAATLEAAAKVETDATAETSDIVEGDGDVTTVNANSQTPAKAAASSATASPASATNPNAAASGATASAPDMQAVAADPAAGQAKAAAATLEAAAKVETDATAETSDIVEGDGDVTTVNANSQTPAKAAASSATASPASATNPNAAASGATASAPDMQAVAADPAAGQAKAAATVDALAASAPAPHEAARVSTTHTAAQAAAPAATMQVYTRMIERFDGRAQRFEIRLDPAELGRVDVRIEIGADKKVHAVLAAHDSAALNDLMRGHRALERALADAGIDLADGGVKFELASDSNRNASTGDGESRSPTAPNVWRSFELTNPSAEAAVKPVAQPWRQSRLDLVA